MQRVSFNKGQRCYFIACESERKPPLDIAVIVATHAESVDTVTRK